MKKIYGLYNALNMKLGWLPALLTRITLAQVFLESGWGKLHHLDKVIAFFQSLGIPAPQLQAPFVAGTELVGGVLILIGLATRPASIMVGATMMVALLTTKRADIGSFSDLTGMIEYLYLVLFAWLIIKGAGRCSVDALLAKKLEEN